jgi:hypothetical protein
MPRILGRDGGADRLEGLRPLCRLLAEPRHPVIASRGGKSPFARSKLQEMDGLNLNRREVGTWKTKTSELEQGDPLGGVPLFERSHRKNLISRNFF